MKKVNSLFIVIICFLSLTFYNSYANVVIPDSENKIIEKIGGKTLLVFNLEAGESPEWFISSKTTVKKLKNPPRTMLRVFAVKASPDKNFLAILSAGEGHPEINVFDLKDILDDKKTELIQGIDPYPGVVDINKWEGTNLHITSNMFLSERADKYSRIPESLPLFSIEPFVLNIATGNIKPVSEELKKPVEYYGNHLIEGVDDQSPHTELSAFNQLNEIKAIPFLKKALRMEQYSTNKKEIQQLLLKLEKK